MSDCLKPKIHPYINESGTYELPCGECENCMQHISDFLQTEAERQKRRMKKNARTKNLRRLR